MTALGTAISTLFHSAGARADQAAAHPCRLQFFGSNHARAAVASSKGLNPVTASTYIGSRNRAANANNTRNLTTWPRRVVPATPPPGAITRSGRSEERRGGQAG